MIKKKIDIRKLAELEYHGSEGITKHCIDAIARLLHFGDHIEKAMLLSSEADQWECRTHCFIVTIDYERQIVIKSGFSSGYSGEGPKGLSKALQLLLRYDVEIEEVDVKMEVIERADKSCLLIDDIELLESSQPIRPIRYYDYIRINNDRSLHDDREIKALFPFTVPLSIIDTRIIDLALNLEEHPDASLLSGYRRLESLIREKANIEGSGGHKLFSKAFHGDKSPLYWRDIEAAEINGRVSLFSGTYMAYRNKRAHHEQDYNLESAVREFLLLNELYFLESLSVARE